MKKARGYVSVVRHVPPFAWLSDGQFDWIAPTIQRRKYPAQALINACDAPEKGVHVVLSGRVRLAIETSDGRELITSVVRANDFFGEVNLFENTRDLVIARALEQSEVLYVPASALLTCFQENPRAAVCMLQKVTQRLGTSYCKLADFAFTTVYQRVAAVLLEHMRGEDGDGSVQVGSQQIAALVGCSREMVSRVIRDMLQKGIARKNGRRLVVLQSHALWERAGLSERSTAQRIH